MYDDFFKELTLPGICLELSRHFFVSYTNPPSLNNVPGSFVYHAKKDFYCTINIQ